MEQARASVADDDGIGSRRARRADDRPEVARPLDPLRGDEQRPRAELDPRQVDRPAADDREQPVRARTSRDREEGSPAELDDLGAAARRLGDERGVGGAQVQLGRRVDLSHGRARLERVDELSVALGEEHVRGAVPAEAPEGLQASVRRAGDRESSCHGSCFRGRVRAGTKRRAASAEETSGRAT
jgi:hypothetical protein